MEYYIRIPFWRFAPTPETSCFGAWLLNFTGCGIGLTAHGIYIRGAAPATLTRRICASSRRSRNLARVNAQSHNTLSLANNALTNTKGLEKLTQLKFLHLGNNQLTDVKGLEKLTQLKTLYLSNNQLTEVPKGLEKLMNLTGLDIRYNPDLTKAQIAELQKALPKCNIYSNPKK